MMARLQLEADWQAAPEDEAFGPEVPTWAHLAIRADDFVLTRNGPLGPTPPAELLRDHVEGPVSGLAEWVCDHLGAALWERLPVSRLRPDSGEVRVPNDTDAANDWSAWPDDRDALSGWYGRHTFGVASSQLALPSLVFAPDPELVCVAAFPLPEKIHPNVRFLLPSSGLISWHRREDLRDGLVEFVQKVIDAARRSPANVAWSDWLSKRLESAISIESDSAQRRRWLYGAEAAARLNAPHDARETGTAELVEQLLGDLRPGLTGAVVDRLFELMRQPPRAGDERNESRKTLSVLAAALSGKPYEQGYALAKAVRRILKLGNDPLERVDIQILQALGIGDSSTEAEGLFSAMSVVHDRRPAVIVDRTQRSVSKTRQALCVATGRLLCDLGQARRGALADSPYARTQATQRARAFAAELLAPLEIVREYANDPDALADDYGISRGAARWRIENLERRRT
jgi:hypothetical protein